MILAVVNKLGTATPQMGYAALLITLIVVLVMYWVHEK